MQHITGKQNVNRRNYITNHNNGQCCPLQSRKQGGHALPANKSHVPGSDVMCWTARERDSLRRVLSPVCRSLSLTASTTHSSTACISSAVRTECSIPCSGVSPGPCHMTTCEDWQLLGTPAPSEQTASLDHVHRFERS